MAKRVVKSKMSSAGRFLASKATPKGLLRKRVENVLRAKQTDDTPRTQQRRRDTLSTCEKEGELVSKLPQ